jgi:hypothetical protein
MTTRSRFFPKEWKWFFLHHQPWPRGKHLKLRTKRISKNGSEAISQNPNNNLATFLQIRVDFVFPLNPTKDTQTGDSSASFAGRLDAVDFEKLRRKRCSGKKRCASN